MDTVLYFVLGIGVIGLAEYLFYMIRALQEYRRVGAWDNLSIMSAMLLGISGIFLGGLLGIFLLIVLGSWVVFIFDREAAMATRFVVVGMVIILVWGLLALPGFNAGRARGINKLMVVLMFLELLGVLVFYMGSFLVTGHF